MDSTSKLGVLTALFLTSFSGRKSFSTQRTSCLGWQRWRKRRKSWKAAEAQGKQEDKEASFPWHFDMDRIKEVAGICLARSRDNANPCLLIGWDLQGEAGVLKFLKCNKAACRGPAWSSDKLLLAAGHDQRNSSTVLDQGLTHIPPCRIARTNAPQINAWRPLFSKDKDQLVIYESILMKAMLSCCFSFLAGRKRIIWQMI